MESPFKNILIFLEASESSIDAVRYAVMLAKFHQAKLWAVFVVDTKALQDLLRARIFIKTEELEYEHDLEEDGRRYLNYAAEIAREKGFKSLGELGLKRVRQGLTTPEELYRAVGEA